MNEAVIVAAKRTAFGKYGGKLRHLEPELLLQPLFNYFKNNYATIVSNIDDVILGNVVGNGGNIARKALLEAGLIYIAGGVESTSRAPWKIKRPQSVYETHLPEFYERASFAPIDQDPSMIQAAENVAERYGISRFEQDEFAWYSHQKTLDAYQHHHITQEITPLTIKGEIFEQDESIKTKLTQQTLGRLKPLLPNGSITAGNCCMKNDGAVLLLVMEKSVAQVYGIQSGLSFIDQVTVGVDPNILGIGPVPAIEKVLAKQQLSLNDVDAVELNEAFASQVLASQQALNIPAEKLKIGRASCRE